MANRLKSELGATFLTALLLTAPAFAGTISGVITAKGPDVPGATASDGAYSSLRYRFAEKVDYSHLQDFVVFIDQVVPGAVAPDTAHEVTVTQRDATFEPHVLAVCVGTKVAWPNADDIYHNVFSISETQSFDLGLYTKTDKPKEVVFTAPGQVDVFCAIHAKMHCIVIVSPSPFIAKVSAGHTYELRDVPAGTYKLKVWHERLPAQVVQVSVPAEGEVKADFVMGPAGAPKS